MLIISKLATTMFFLGRLKSNIHIFIRTVSEIEKDNFFPPVTFPAIMVDKEMWRADIRVIDRKEGVRTIVVERR